MKSKMPMRMTVITLFATLATPVGVAAQEQKEERNEHHHYKLFDMGTLGGPGSFPVSGSRDINFSGLATAEADTPIPAECSLMGTGVPSC